ncbi:MAG: glyoxalase [Crocinitomicaceae bacterium]|nr:glyoxalase [Crocinitomicaceae bacterium]
MEKVRPILPNELTIGALKAEELFQNMVLRPIIKMQHDILVYRVKSYFASKKVVFHLMDKKKRVVALESAFKNDNPFKKEIQGMVIGQLNGEEFKQYLQTEKSFNKRIIQMVKNRMIDSVIELSRQ